MSKPRALDLFCGAGGATRGLQLAGFHVTGVDINAQPNYCGDKFIRADIFDRKPEWMWISEYDFVWASPPCQGYTAMRHAPGAKGDAPLLIREMRRILTTSRWKTFPWVIENVECARWDMKNPMLLCGSMFGLRSQGCQLRRHRLFETNFPISPPTLCSHKSPVIGVYGGHARMRSAKYGGRGTRDVWTGGHIEAASEAMGIDWMTLGELSEAIPPEYSKFIGNAALNHINQARAA